MELPQIIIQRLQEFGLTSLTKRIWELCENPGEGYAAHANQTWEEYLHWLREEHFRRFSYIDFEPAITNLLTNNLLK